MPLTTFQREIALLLADNRSADSYLAGGAALHIAPNSQRFSNDLDYFHDSVERVAQAFEDDRLTLEKANFSVQIAMSQRGFVRAIVAKGKHTTKVEWAHDSSWRFMPPIKSPEAGISLHPIDLAVNKMLALAGRDEPRDFLDIHDTILPLGALVWAAVGKDPGFTPQSLFEIIQRRGRYQPEDFIRLHLTEPVDLISNKKKWLQALDDCSKFISTRPMSQAGCLYYSDSLKRFVMPAESDAATPHFGTPGGVIPVFIQ